MGRDRRVSEEFDHQLAVAEEEGGFAHYRGLGFGLAGLGILEGGGGT